VRPRRGLQPAGPGGTGRQAGGQAGRQARRRRPCPLAPGPGPRVGCVIRRSQKRGIQARRAARRPFGARLAMFERTPCGPGSQREWDGAEGPHRGRYRRRRGGSNNGLVVAPYQHWARGWWHPHRQRQKIFWDGPGRARAGPQGAPPLGGCRGQGSIGRFFRARRRGQGPPAAAGPPPQLARRAEGRPLSMLARAPRPPQALS
jgi:hypothetical protein